jgi:eukaryotic-like serine/threonine-protein kinase
MLAEGFQVPRAQRIGPYEVLLDIGSGGMGIISLARATGEPVGAAGFTRLVALKRPHGALASDAEVLKRFLDEARLLAQVHHANVVGIHQIGSDAGGQFLVLDYIEGGTLDELLSRTILRRKKLPPPVALRIVADVLAGLHAVHEAADVEGRPLRILHRDVSAQNVLVGKDGVARLADFGIAKAVTSSTVTDKAYLQGRVAYMAPEYLRRQDVDRRLDVYAMGVTLWTALTSELPWRNASEAQIVHSIVFDGVPPLSAAGVTVAPNLQSIVARACDRDPALRYPTARDMLDAIEDLGRQTGWIASHAEVASLVDELLGRELSARRAALAQRLSSPSLPGADTGPTSRPAIPAPPPAPSAESTGRTSVEGQASAETTGRTSSASPAFAPNAETTGRTSAAGPASLETTGRTSAAGPASAETTGRTSAAGPASAETTGRTSSASPAPAPSSTLTGPISSSTVPQIPRRRAHPLLAGAIVIALVGGALAVAWKLRSSNTTELPTPPSSGETPSASSVPSALVAASSPPALTESAPPPASAPPTSTGAGVLSGGPQRPLPPPSGLPHRGPSSGAGAGAPASLPTGISTSNPYRNR